MSDGFTGLVQAVSRLYQEAMAQPATPGVSAERRQLDALHAAMSRAGIAAMVQELDGLREFFQQHRQHAEAEASALTVETQDAELNQLMQANRQMLLEQQPLQELLGAVRALGPLVCSNVPEGTILRPHELEAVHCGKCPACKVNAAVQRCTS